MFNTKIEIPDGFLCEETRNEYVVSEKMKKVWAVQLDMLSEVERICSKYGLTYFADSGTLLGAIRHGGFIPWDDDIDIVMLRKDYDRFWRIAKKELKYPFEIQNTYTDRNLILGFSRVRNLETTAITRSDRMRGTNHGIFIDIFPLDCVPASKVAFKLWIKRIKVIKKFLYAATYGESEFYQHRLKKILWIVGNTYVGLFGGRTKAFRHYERICARYNKKPTAFVSYVAYSHGKAKHIWERKGFLSSHYVPFEFTKINIPDGYDSRLKKEYGDYMTPAEAPTAHAMIILAPDTPYTKYNSK